MGNSSTEKKTDLRIIKTHKALCDTFMELCSEKKFEEITVGELCDKALIRRATFYKHFADKYDFFSFFVRYVQDDIENCFKETQDDKEGTDYYSFLFEKCIFFLEEHRKMVENMLSSAAFASLLDIFCGEIQRNIYLHQMEEEKNCHLPELDGKITAAFFAGGIVQIYRYWLTNPEQVTKEEIYDNYRKLIHMYHLR